MKELTQENYYQDKEYLSYSRMKQFLKCPARALAVEGGAWTESRERSKHF